ncbi:hypothetical protein [Janibacter sp. GS2]|uniref:hypothetical protein n=1 Tax=Janibacter sp. GS2 TaxID=3442646 RepID=UPI003EBF745C
MKKLWMNTIDALRPTPSGKHSARRHADEHQAHEMPHDHRMSDRFYPTLSTR